MNRRITPSDEVIDDGAGFGALVGGLTGIVMGLSAISVGGVSLIASGLLPAALGAATGGAIGSVVGAAVGSLAGALFSAYNKPKQ